MNIAFHGAARTVTGSRHLLSVGGKNVLLDCGLFQGRRAESDLWNRSFGFDPTQVDAVIMSHAHIDHSGALPSLVRGGFRGTIHGTLATADLLSVMLRDSGMIQEKDTAYLNKRLSRNGEPLKEPLYTLADVDRTLELVEGHRYHQPIQVLPGITATFYDAGHILGSSIISLDLTEGNEKRTLIFSGDLGRKDLPILRDPDIPPGADALIIESTYGDRVHGPVSQVEDRLAELINRVFAARGKLIIPSFAVGRTQDLVYSISRLLREGRIPRVLVFVDSPLAVNVTDIFARHPEAYDQEISEVLRSTGDPFGFKLLEYVRDVAESKELNERPGPFIVISASGMAESGRILHHLANGIEDPRNVILFVGYQAENTLGRRLIEGSYPIRIFNETYRLRAEVVVMNEFSAHADRNELLEWTNALRRKPARAFVVHGEESQSIPFAKRLRESAGIPEVLVPARGEAHPL